MYQPVPTRKTTPQKGVANSWAAYLNSSALERAALEDQASAAKPLRWWYNYFTSQRARFISNELPAGGDGYTTALTANDLDATWTPITDIEFCPMVRGYIANNETELGWLTTECPEAMHLLGPTEPDQANPPANPGFPVADVITMWGAVYEPWRAAVPGRRLGAPATAQTHPAHIPGLWFDQFMDLIASNGYHVDFIPVHYFFKYHNPPPEYPDALDTGATMAAGLPILRTYLRDIWNAYHLPMWPEISIFEAAAGLTTEEELATCMRLCVEIFRSLELELGVPIVERWNFWPLGPQPYSRAGLYAADGTITVVGNCMKTL